MQLIYKLLRLVQAWIAQLVVHWIGTTEVVGSNPDKEEDFSLKNQKLNAD